MRLLISLASQGGSHVGFDFQGPSLAGFALQDPQLGVKLRKISGSEAYLSTHLVLIVAYPRRQEVFVP